MVEDRDIKRQDLQVRHNGEYIPLRLVQVRLWDNIGTQYCSRFNVQLKIPNKEADLILDDNYLEGGSWTVVAHSDHNPNGGHDIRDRNDAKQLHVDVHPKLSNGGYNRTHVKLADGNPPENNHMAIEEVTRFMRSNADQLFNQYIEYF